MKKIVYIFLLIFCLFGVYGCANKEENITGDLSEIFKELYVGIPADDVPMVEQIKITKENEEYYIGIKNLDYKEALVSEPTMSSIAHSVVLIRMEDNSDIENVKKEILENAPRDKWVCSGVDEENIIVESRGDLIILIMDNNYASIIRDNFFKL